MATKKVQNEYIDQVVVSESIILSC